MVQREDGLADRPQTFPSKLNLLNDHIKKFPKHPEMVSKYSYKRVFRDFVSQTKESRGSVL